MLTLLLFWLIPKNLFPTQDTGQVSATTISAQDVGYARMARLQQQVAQALLADPAVISLSSSVGVDGINPTLNQGRMLINLRPVGDRAKLSSVLTALQDRADRVAGLHLYLQPVQDLTIDTEAGLTPYRFALLGADQDLVNQWGAKLATRLAAEPDLRNVSAPGLGLGRSVIVDINRDAAARLGLSALAVDNALYDAFGQRIVSTIYTPIKPESRHPAGERGHGSATRRGWRSFTSRCPNGTTVPLGVRSPRFMRGMAPLVRVAPIAIPLGHDRLRPRAWGVTRSRRCRSITRC